MPRLRALTWALCGKACHEMTPSRIAADTAAIESASGQWKPMPCGQSRYSDTTYDCRPVEGCQPEALVHIRSDVSNDLQGMSYAGPE